MSSSPSATEQRAPCPTCGTLCTKHVPDMVTAVYVPLVSSEIATPGMERRKAVEDCIHICHQHRLRMNEIGNRPAGDAVAYLESVMASVIEADEAFAVSATVRAVPVALWDEIMEFIEDHVDVRDGEDGPQPNRAMQLQTLIEAEVK